MPGNPPHLVLCMMLAGPASNAEAREPVETRASERTQLAVGASLLGLSLGAFGMLAAGTHVATQAEADYAAGPTRSDRDAAQRRGHLANGLVIAGALAGGLAGVVGTVFVVRGAQKRRARLRLAASPAGFQLGVRF